MHTTVGLCRRVLLALVAIPAVGVAQGRVAGTQARQPHLGTRGVPIIQEDGLRFKDLDRKGKVDPYEDWRLTPEVRARDLVARMTLEEKAGTMMHGTARTPSEMGVPGAGGAYDTVVNRALIDSAKVTSMITRLGGDPGSLAAQNNTLQEIAEHTRLGIPLTISTDPRSHFQYVPGASVRSNQFWQGPEPLGLAAIGDASLVRHFGDIARREYRAVGIQMALSPQADVATEPRWSRVNGTFGEDAALAERMVRAYVEGFQHGTRGVDSAAVATVVKHWVGYGAAREGAPAGERPSFADVGMPWGVESLTMRARFVKAVQAGVDQFGGTERGDMLVDAVRAGKLTEARLDSSVARILALKFALGLFEDPYVDASSAPQRVGTDAFRAAALGAQHRALVLLENKGALLPLRHTARQSPLRVYLHGVASTAVAHEGWAVVANPAQA